MARPRPLTPHEARRTLAHRFAPRADRLRQLNTRFGLRPYRCFLVWTKWSGGERGAGEETVLPGGRIELLPTPKVRSLDNVAAQFFSGGVLPVGSLRVTEISALYTRDQLAGLAVPNHDFTEENVPPRPRSAEDLPKRPSVTSLPQPFDFYWEVVEDGRGDDPAVRSKFRLAAWPNRNPGGVQWECLIERVSSDANRDGTSTNGFDPD